MENLCCVINDINNDCCTVSVTVSQQTQNQDSFLINLGHLTSCFMPQLLILNLHVVSSTYTWLYINMRLNVVALVELFQRRIEKKQKQKNCTHVCCTVPLKLNHAIVQRVTHMSHTWVIPIIPTMAAVNVWCHVFTLEKWPNRWIFVSFLSHNAMHKTGNGFSDSRLEKLRPKCFPAHVVSHPVLYQPVKSLVVCSVYTWTWQAGVSCCSDSQSRSDIK